MIIHYSRRDIGKFSFVFLRNLRKAGMLLKKELANDSPARVTQLRLVTFETDRHKVRPSKR